MLSGPPPSQILVEADRGENLSHAYKNDGLAEAAKLAEGDFDPDTEQQQNNAELGKGLYFFDVADDTHAVGTDGHSHHEVAEDKRKT